MEFSYSKLVAERVIIFEVQKGDKGAFVTQLKKSGHGFALRGAEQKTIVIDGRMRSKRWVTNDHMLAIEAHELGHIIADTDDEVLAEAEGIRILEKNGLTDAANLLRDRGFV